MSTDNYRTNSSGHLVPVESIKTIDLLRDDTVTRIIANAKIQQEQMAAFKQQTMSDINTFVNLSAEEYGIKWGGKRGNLTLSSYDGKYKVQLAVSDTLSFDERLQIAKQLVDECIHEWTAGSNANVRALIEHAFQTDKQGKLNTARIFGLMRLDMEGEKWALAMVALKDSIVPASTCEYLRLYERVENTDKYQQITMDISRL